MEPLRFVWHGRMSFLVGSEDSRLCVILPVEEQVSEVDVNEHEFFVQCNSATEN